MAELKEGKKAPSFKLPSSSGCAVSLNDFKGKTLVLYFYPKDITPGCTQQATDFTALHSKFKRKKAQVVGISRDSIARHQKFTEKHGLNFPLLSDEETKTCEAYGVWKEKSLYGKKFMGIERTTFIIDPGGKIRKIYPKVKAKGHAEEVLKEL